MTITYTKIESPDGAVTIQRIDENGLISFMDESNPEYINKATLASELSNPSTPQAGE